MLCFWVIMLTAIWSVAVDTACSSSLVTTHLAAQAVMGGEIGAAASMGVNLTLVQSWTRACLRAGMLSEDGRYNVLELTVTQYSDPAHACLAHLLLL